MIDEMAEMKKRIASQFIEALPHAKALGMEVVDIGDGVAEMALPYDARLIGNPKTGVLHGGAVSTLLDSTCGAAVMSHPDHPALTATIDLRIDYMRSAKPGQKITARAECYRVTRSVAFVRASATDGDAANGPVAMATGAFTVEQPREKTKVKS